MLKTERTEDDKWQAEDDARTLMRAEEIKADKSRIKKALAILKDQSMAIKKIKGTE